jgi:hypothetical protein
MHFILSINGKGYKLCSFFLFLHIPQPFGSKTKRPELDIATLLWSSISFSFNDDGGDDDHLLDHFCRELNYHVHVQNPPFAP